MFFRKMSSRLFLAIVLTTTFFRQRMAFGESKKDNSKPISVPFSIPWDFRKTETLDKKFKISKKRTYYLFISFKYSDPEQHLFHRKELSEFLGDNSMIRVTKESAESENPVEVAEYTEEEKAFLKQGGSLVSGEYYKKNPKALGPREKLHEIPTNTMKILSKKGQGTLIPIYIKLEKILDDQSTKIVLEDTVSTSGSFRHGGGRMDRLIKTINLKEGIYKVNVKSATPQILINGVETQFGIGWYPK